MRTLLSSLLALLVSASLAVAAERLIVREKTGSVPETGQVKYLELEYAGERYSIHPPANWRVQADSEDGLRFSSASNRGGTVAIQFQVENVSNVLASAEALRENIVPYYTDATLNEEFTAYSGNQHGKGIELRFTLQGTPMLCRTAVIPLPRGYASFVLTCAVEDAQAGLQAFGSALTSFQRFVPAKISGDTISGGVKKQS
ncbi:MAG TPA: hypothetical protein VNT99_14560 [Methylomirabilota bacterium]|nr:hypothetical protein [Methylomirabilota bacterium]